MRITRKGYYEVYDPDGNYISRHTSRDESYEAVTENGQEGIYTITCPNREVEVLLGVINQGGGTPPAGGSTVLWATDPDTTSPFNYTSLHTTPSNGGYGEGSYTLAAVNDTDYGGNLLALTHSDSGQIQIGAILSGTVADNIFTDLGSGDMYIRYLLKFVDSGAGISGDWTDEGFGWEWKWLDFGDNGNDRVIIKFRQPSYGSPSADYVGLNIRVDPGVEWQHWQTEASDPFTHSTLYYLEIGLLADGSLKVWLAAHDGTDTEYDLTTNLLHDSGAGWHSWNPNLVASGDRPMDTFINHQDDVSKEIRYHMAISDGFIGPGAVTSTY